MFALCVLFASCNNEASDRNSSDAYNDTITIDTTPVVIEQVVPENNQAQQQASNQAEYQQQASDDINFEETYIRPGLISYSDGGGGTTSTYFRVLGNQLEKINEEQMGQVIEREGRQEGQKVDPRTRSSSV